MLRERRTRVSLTQEELAERAGISVRTIADVERGIIRAPRRDTLELIADALELTDLERDEWRTLRRQLSMRRSDTAPSPSLPQPPNQLIGRDREVNAVINLVTQPDTRLVTITGPGGVGKTRIGQAVGHALKDRFADGVAYIELASTQDPELLLQTIAQQLGIRDSDQETPRSRLLRFLGQREMLLILDNAEHLRSAAADLAELLSSTSSLHILVTSRAGLRIGAEYEFPVVPLALPKWDGTRTLTGLQSYPGIQLFVQRARQVRPDFSLTDENSASVSRICAYLDGLPLAIELAAARVKLLPPEQIVPRLVHRLGFLSDGLADSPDRHQTMRAAIGWSYDLLDDADQRFFRRLSTFIGGWTLEAAEVMAPPGVDPVESLSRLVNDNLVEQLSAADGTVRFTMLETVREFGLEQLHILNEYEAVAGDHAALFLRIVEQAEPELRGPGQVEWLERLSVDIANLRSALEWLHRSESDPDRTMRMVASMTWFWETRGYVTEGRSWLIRALEQPSPPSITRMKLLAGVGWFAHIQQDSAAALRYLNEGLELAQSAADRWWESWILHLLGRVAYFDGDADEADRYATWSLEIALDLDDSWIIAWDEHLFGLAAFIRDDLEATRQHYERSLEIRERIEYPEGICLIHGLLGVLSLREGDPEAALQRLRKGLEAGQRIGARWLLINWLANLVFIAAEVGEYERAARLAGFVESMSDFTGAIPIPITRVMLERGIESTQKQLDEETYGDCYETGRSMRMTDAIDEAHSISGESA